MRAAIYARMSTDKQSDTSPEDQIARCREYAEKQGWQVVEDLVAADHGISGASRHNRPKLLSLMARIDEWDVLIAFDFARLARNQEDQGWIRNRIRVNRKQAVEASTGLDLDNVGARVMGVISEEYLEKVRADTHRGLRGRFDRGLATGGCPFGYRTDPIVTGSDAHGHPITAGFRLEIDPKRAPIVQRIFEGYAHQGLGLKALAHQLNAEHLASPRGNGWSPTAIREMLRNSIYRGERIWNRSLWVKDHETGRRKRFERPESEWVHQQDEAWRIVSDELWSAAQTARGKRNERHLRDARGHIRRSAIGSGARRRRLLAGFLECGECGASFHALSGRSWGCSHHRNRGPEICGNEIRVREDVLERGVMGAVREAIDFAERVCRIELNASTDNPLVFDNGDVLSGGNFHGQPVAQALDFMAITLTTLQAMTERRIERLVNPDLSHGLPAFLIENPGIRSGYMMVQITAAALVAESRTLTVPASVGSIPTDANQEDFVPMGMAAAFKAARVLRNAQRVVAAEVLCAVQGIELLKPLSPGRGVRWLAQRVCHPAGPAIAPLTEDRSPAPDLERLAQAVAAGELDPAEFLHSG